MKLPVDPMLPLPDDVKSLKQRLTYLFRLIANQVNGLSEGSIAASYQAQTSAPVGGTYHQGDFVRNSAPVELGTTGSKYTVQGWSCVASGEPGTWVECRNLTGN